MTALVVIAKECVEGKVKTRLHPPLSLAEAAEVAHASLLATLRVSSTVPASRRILFFDGQVSEIPREAAGYEVVRQPTGTLDRRLGHLFDLMHEPTVLIGMDTPQLTAADFDGAFERWPDGVDALFGPADDGGFWALGLRSPRGSLVTGVAMSRPDTGEQQRVRLREAGLAVRDLRPLRDIDTIADLQAVAPSVDGLWPSAAIARSTTGPRR